MSGPGRPPYPITRETFRRQIVQARDEGVTVAEIQRQYPRWSEEACVLRAEWLSSCDETAVLESHRSFEEEDILPGLRAVPPPALFLYGAGSPVVTPEAAREVAEANSNLEMVVVPDAAHMIPWENLAGFMEPVTGFLERVRRKDGSDGH
jgi:N-formylmaleamate deformylase